MTLDLRMNQFRQASRELFNHYFRVDEPSAHSQRAGELQERFADVEQILFQNMVAEPLSLEKVVYGCFVQPNIGVELSFGQVAPIMLNREIDSGYWDFPVNEVTKEVSLLFKTFFDWDNLAYRDHQYVRAQVIDWAAHPETIGKDALIETQYVKYVLRAKRLAKNKSG